MSQLIKISDECYLAADVIAEVTVRSASGHITIRTKDGTGYTHLPQYKQSLWEAQDQLIAKINEALAK